MKITSVNYQKVFPLGQYINERIGVEIQVDPDESEVDALREAKRIVEQFHKDNNPQLYTETPIQPQYFNGSFPIHDKEGNRIHSGVNIEPITPKTQPHSTIEAINSCTTLKVLQEFDLIVQNMGKKYPEIQEAYDNKLKELSGNK